MLLHGRLLLYYHQRCGDLTMFADVSIALYQLKRMPGNTCRELSHLCDHLLHFFTVLRERIFIHQTACLNLSVFIYGKTHPRYLGKSQHDRQILGSHYRPIEKEVTSPLEPLSQPSEKEVKSHWHRLRATDWEQLK